MRNSNYNKTPLILLFGRLKHFLCCFEACVVVTGRGSDAILTPGYGSDLPGGGNASPQQYYPRGDGGGKRDRNLGESESSDSHGCLT